MKTLAVIPARGGSKSIPKKNITNLAGKPLIYYSIDVAKQVFGEVWVSTEDKEIKEVSEKFGAKIIDRPETLSSDTSTDIDWLNHAFETLDCENIVILRPTTPIRYDSTIKEAIEMFEDKQDCTSLRSAHEAPESPYKWFELDIKTGFWKKNPMADLPRQALPSMFIPNGYVDIVKKRIVKAGSAFGDKILSFITAPVTEIDSIAELDYLEYQLR